MKKQQLSLAFVVMGMLFCVCLITSNLLETKLFHVFGQVNLTCGFIVFPISYIINDCIAEVWGYRKARLIIWLGFMMNFFVVLMGGLACVLPPIVPGSDASFREVFGFAPQVAVASFTAFIVGSFLNAWVMSRMKIAARDSSHFNIQFSLRAILSTIVGVEGQPKVSVDILMSLMLTQVVAKTLYEVLVLPLTIRVVKFVKKYEEVDVYDENISYNPLKINQL